MPVLIIKFKYNGLMCMVFYFCFHYVNDACFLSMGFNCIIVTTSNTITLRLASTYLIALAQYRRVRL